MTCGTCIGWLGTRHVNQRTEVVLALKNLELFNIALLAKWKWCFLVDGDASWRGILVHKYGDLPGSCLNNFASVGRSIHSL